MTGAPAQKPGKAERSRGAPGIGASGIHRGTKPVLQCLKFGRRALRLYGRTATEARVRSPSEKSAFEAETERWSATSFGGTRNRKPDRASRDLKSPNPWPSEESGS